jgi:hypothetical protein
MRDITDAIMHEIAKEGWTTPAACNDGYCGHFADQVVKTLGRGQVVGTFGDHEWVYVDGRHYDSETPYGVDDPRDLGYFCREEGRPMPPTPWRPDADADTRDDDGRLIEATEGDQIDLRRAYEVFRQSYEAETGASWSEDKFISRARAWTFYGDADGYVAIRRQRSGMNKLVGIAGDPRSIIRGLSELEQDPAPLWGAVSAPLARMAAKRGLIAPHLYPGGAYLIRALMAMVPASVFGGDKPEVTKDGGLVFNYSDTGTAVKYLIGNKEYFRRAVRQPEIAERLRAVPGASMVLRLLGLSTKTD